MLSVISGVTLPGNGLRDSRCSRSGLAAVRSKSDRLTSCSSSSTPKVKAADLANGSSAMLLLRCFARPDQGALQDDGGAQFEQQGDGGQRTHRLGQLHAGL